MRRKSREVSIGGCPLGNDHPVLVQSMCNMPTHDVAAVVGQIESLVAWGCDLVRVSVPDEEAAMALPLIVSRAKIPVIADIHYRADLAMQAIQAGVAKVRINPGNISSSAKIQALAECALDHNVPIRVGANAGSLSKRLLDKHGGATPQALADSCLEQVVLLERCGFESIVLSVKASDIQRTIAANRLIAAAVDYPIHLGVTEAGTLQSGMIKSAIGIGALLLEGIGDTVRVSLSAPPENEIYAAWEIVQHLGLRRRGLRIISCPGCARSIIDVYGIAADIEARFMNVPGLAGVTVAVMGCAVNGPGEAKEADLGVAGLPHGAVFFSQGKVGGKIAAGEIGDFLIGKINDLCNNQERND